MAIRLLILVVTLCLYKTVLTQTPSQPAPPDDCLMKCMNDLYKKNPRVDAMKIMDVENVQVGNVTAMCPRMNDTTKLDSGCAAMKDLRKCTESCPDTQIKKLTLSAFTGPQFICIDRYDDVKRYGPCLSDKCPDVQRTCIPRCGSIENNAQKISGLMRAVHGDGAGPPAAPPGHAGTNPSGSNRDVDLSQITKVIADTCTTISCFMQCSEAPVTKECGKEAYLLQRDLIWTMFSSLAQSMSSMGLQTQWPDECKVLASNGGHSVGATAGPIPPTAGTTTTSPPPTTIVAVLVTKVEVKTVKVNETTIVQKCDHPPCGGSSAVIPSIVLLILAIVMAFRKI